MSNGQIYRRFYDKDQLKRQKAEESRPDFV